MYPFMYIGLAMKASGGGVLLGYCADRLGGRGMKDHKYKLPDGCDESTMKAHRASTVALTKKAVKRQKEVPVMTTAQFVDIWENLN